MMDLSDGLGADLPRLAQASGLAFEVDETALPRTRGCTVQQAIADGEDYELLFAIPAQDTLRLQRGWKKRFANLPLSRIGRLIPKSEISNSKLSAGYVHFQ